MTAAPEHESASVRIVCAGTGLCRHHARISLTKLRIVILRRNLRFGYRFERWVDDDDAEDWIPIVSAIQLK